jgi:hypothetical protein
MASAGRDRVSTQLESWLTSDEPTTIGRLVDVFGEKAFAVACFLLMAPSALPIPTGGATHVFDAVAILCSLQLLIGRDEVWIPQRWQGKELGSRSVRVMSAFVRMVKRCERWSKPRLPWLMTSRIGQSAWGLVITVLIVGAFVSPPFSGLDTLPSLGVVLICIGLLLEDALFGLIGALVGGGGIGLTISLGVKAGHFVKGVFA